MDEYIERDALMRRIKEIHCAECDSYHGVRCRVCWVDDTLGYIDSEPAADVAPVRHGRWIYDHWCEFKCSVCGEFSNSKPYRGKENYCPNCGAKMDGGDSDER